MTAMVLVSFITALLAELSGAALGFGPAILYASGRQNPRWLLVLTEQEISGVEPCKNPWLNNV